MTTTTQTASAIVVTAEIDALFVQPMLSAAIAAQVARRVVISAGSLRIPRVAQAPSAAWVREGEEIPITDAVLDEIEVIPAKLAGLTVITRELADDSSPEAAQVVGDLLARDAAKKIDAAFFGALPAPAPAGLASLGGVTQLGTGAKITNLDSFSAGIYAAAGRNATITSWVASSTDALALAQLKQSSSSNVGLLTPDPTAPGRSLIAGVPLLVSPAVAPGTVWGVDSSSAYLVIRDDVTIESDSSAFFTSDRIAIRARTRVAFGFPDPAAVVRLSVGASA